VRVAGRVDQPGSRSMLRWAGEGWFELIFFIDFGFIFAIPSFFSLSIYGWVTFDIDPNESSLISTDQYYKTISDNISLFSHLLRFTKPYQNFIVCHEIVPSEAPTTTLVYSL
jgi:hypothetical protein